MQRIFRYYLRAISCVIASLVTCPKSRIFNFLYDNLLLRCFLTSRDRKSTSCLVEHKIGFFFRTFRKDYLLRYDYVNVLFINTCIIFLIIISITPHWNRIQKITLSTCTFCLAIISSPEPCTFHIFIFYRTVSPLSTKHVHVLNIKRILF